MVVPSLPSCVVCTVQCAGNRTLVTELDTGTNWPPAPVLVTGVAVSAIVLPTAIVTGLLLFELSLPGACVALFVPEPFAALVPVAVPVPVALPVIPLPVVDGCVFVPLLCCAPPFPVDVDGVDDAPPPVPPVVGVVDWVPLFVPVLPLPLDCAVMGCGTGCPPPATAVPHPANSPTAPIIASRLTSVRLLFMNSTSFCLISREVLCVLAAMRIIYNLATGVALGVMIFFTAVVALQVFATLPLGTAGDVLAAIFPPYYTLVTLLCGIAYLCSFGLLKSRHSWWLRSGQWALFIATVFMAIGWLILLPIMNRIRATIPTFSGPPTHAIQSFFMYHGISMGLNLLSIALLLWTISVFSAKRISLL